MPGAGAAPTQAAAGGFCLQLSPGRDRVRLGEPVLVAVSLINCSKEPRQAEDLLDPAYGFLQVSLSPPDGGKRVAYRPAVRRDARGKRPRTLSPGEKLSAWVPLYAGADGWMLIKPGPYQVHAEYSVDGTRVSATPVAITVEAPPGPEERAAAELLMDSASALLLLTGRDDARGSSRLAALLRDHAKSPLAPYAQLALATARMQERFDPALKTFRTPDCRGAVELLRPAVARIRDPFLAAIGTRSLADCLRALGRHAEADDALRGYAQSHPGGLELPGVREALRGKERRRS